jgi:hypothetical protein
VKIVNVAGTRPNFIKIAPLMREMLKHPEIQPIPVHTGQHYDERSSDIFFRRLGIPEPGVDLQKLSEPSRKDLPRRPARSSRSDGSMAVRRTSGTAMRPRESWTFFCARSASRLSASASAPVPKKTLKTVGYVQVIAEKSQ